MAVTIYLSILFLALYIVGLVIYKVVFLRERKRQAVESRLGGRVIARISEMPSGTVKKFWLICRKYRVDGFLINYEGNFYAYVNRCRHMPTPLDFVRYQFFTQDGQHLICMTHGALYEPATGLCVDGPCKGASLYPLSVRVDQDEILVGCPAGDVSVLAD